MLNDRRWLLALSVALLLPPLLGGSVGVRAQEPPRPAEGRAADGSRGDERPARAACTPGALLADSPWPEPLPAPWQRWRELMALGKCQLAAGDAALAAHYFRQGGAEAPELQPVWRLNLLRALLITGNREEAVTQLADLAGATAPGVRESVRGILNDTMAHARPGDAALAAYLTAYVRAAPPEPEDYDLVLALHQLGGAEPAEGRAPLSLPLLLWRGPKDEDSAEKWADVPGRLIAEGQPPAPEDYLSRARRLRRLRLASMIRDEFAPERIAALPAPLPTETAHSIGQIWFWALGRSRAFTQALRALESEETRALWALDPQATLTLAVEFHLRAGQPGAALEKLAQLEQVAPQAYVLPGYYLDLARRARLRGDLAGMERWCRRVIENFPAHPRAPEAYWLLVWEDYRRGAAEEAARWAEAFLASPDQTGGQERFLYWLGRIERQLGRDEAADQAWARLIAESPTNFYSLLAQGEHVDRLAVPAAEPAGPPDPPGPPPDYGEVWARPDLRLPVLLQLMGEDALAQAALIDALEAPVPALRELAQAMVRLRRYDLAQKVAVRYLRPQPGDGADPDPAALRLIYPIAYWDQVAATSRHRLSPYFVLAVIREESHFRVDADSSAGAKGLMQLMPSTALAVARDHGLPEDEQALLQPDVNIALGKLYLERLAKRFDDNPLHIAAGYNAGPTIVRRWLRQLGSLPPDEFVEAIPYAETQNYVKKVLATSILYRRLYLSR